MKISGINVVAFDAIPEGKFRWLDMNVVKKRIAIVNEPRPTTFESKIVGDKIQVTATQPAMRFIDLQTGKIF